MLSVTKHLCVHEVSFSHDTRRFFSASRLRFTLEHPGEKMDFRLTRNAYGLAGKPVS